MELTLYRNFYKRNNSTKQPSGGFTVNVKLKDGCSVQNPVFLINGVDLDVNYCYWSNAYYFVDDIILSNNNIYELQCSIDVLATWKIVIGNYNAYIERSDSDYDDKINDTMLTSQQLISGAGIATTDVDLDGTGCYVFRTISSVGIQLYATESMELLGAIYSNTTYNVSSGSIWDEIVQSIGLSAVDASQYLLNVMWVPCAISDLAGTNASTIDLGFWDYEIPVNLSAKKLTTTHKATSKPLALPTNTHTDFRRYNPTFSKYSIYLPGVGTVALNSLDAGRGNIAITVDLDLISGAIGYMLRDTGSGNYIASFNGQLGVNIPMVSTNVNSAGFIESIAGTAVAIAEAETGVGMLAAGAAGAVNAVKTLGSEQGSINGYNGNIGMIQRFHNVTVSLEQFGSKQFPASVVGRPLHEYRVINTLSGYIKCGAASIDVAGCGPDADMINNYLNSGFYYE